jgi:flagellar export protein FliJ
MSKGHPPFKLQSVLTLRAQQSQACQVQLTQLQAQRTQLTDQLAQIRQHIQQVHDDSGQWSSGGGNHWLGYLQALRIQEANCLQRIQAQDKAIDEQQQVLTQARIKEKTLDRLKETHHATCLTVQRYHEAAFMDEMASRATSRF